MSISYLKGVIQGLTPAPRAAVQVDPVVFTTGNEVYQFSTDSLPSQQKSISTISTIWIDASNFTSGKNVKVVCGLQTFNVQGGNAGYFPVATPMPFIVTISTSAGFTGTVLVELFNYDIQGTAQNNNNVSLTGSLSNNIAQVGGTNISIGQQVAAASMPVVIASNQSAVQVAQSGTTTGKFTQAVTATVVAVNAASTNLKTLNIGNSGATGAYLQLFNSSVAGVTLGTTVPAFSFFVPAGGSIAIDFSTWPNFGAALCVAATTTRGGATAPAAALDVNISY